MVEISDQELAIKNRAVALLDRLWSDPKEGMSFKKKVKELLPDTKIPELDIVESVTAPLIADIEARKEENKKLAERLDNWEKSQTDLKEENALQARLDRAKKQYSFTDDGMQKLVDRMKAEKSADVEATAAWVAAQERKSKPITDSALMPTAMNLYGSNQADENFADLNKDPIGWAEREMVKILNEFADTEAA